MEIEAITVTEKYSPSMHKVTVTIMTTTYFGYRLYISEVRKKIIYL
jgi:hypothetical protein